MQCQQMGNRCTETKPIFISHRPFKPDARSNIKLQHWRETLRGYYFFSPFLYYHHGTIYSPCLKTIVHPQFGLNYISIGFSFFPSVFSKPKTRNVKFVLFTFDSFSFLALFYFCIVFFFFHIFNLAQDLRLAPAVYFPLVISNFI